jgi:hypothetical protein
MGHISFWLMMADDVNLLQHNIDTIKKNTETLGNLVFLRHIVFFFIE